MFSIGLQFETWVIPSPTGQVVSVDALSVGGCGDDEVHIQRSDPAAWCMSEIHSNSPGLQAASLWSRRVALSCFISLPFLKYVPLASVRRHDLHGTGRLATRAMLQPGWGGQGYENWGNNEKKKTYQESSQLQGTRHKRYKSVRMQAVTKPSELLSNYCCMAAGQYSRYQSRYHSDKSLASLSGSLSVEVQKIEFHHPFGWMMIAGQVICSSKVCVCSWHLANQVQTQTDRNVDWQLPWSYASFWRLIGNI